MMTTEWSGLVIALFIFVGIPLIVVGSWIFVGFVSFQKSEYKERNHRITFDNFIHMYEMAPHRWTTEYNLLSYTKTIDSKHFPYSKDIRYYFNFSIIDTIKYRHWRRLVKRKKKREEKEAIERERDKELAKLAGYWQEDIDAYTKMCEAETQIAIEKIQKIAKTYGCRVEVLKDEV